MELPVLLPADAQIPPSGENALKFHDGFLRTACPKCGGAARRETDTLDTFVDSSWYFLRFASQPDDKPFDRAEVDKWRKVLKETGLVLN